MTRADLRNAYRRLTSHQQCAPHELAASVERVAAICHRAAHFGWLNSAAQLRAEAATRREWSRTAYANAARSCLDYARQTRP